MMLAQRVMNAVKYPVGYRVPPGLWRTSVCHSNLDETVNEREIPLFLKIILRQENGVSFSKDNPRHEKDVPFSQKKIFWARKIVFHFPKTKSQAWERCSIFPKNYSEPRKLCFIFHKKSQTWERCPIFQINSSEQRKLCFISLKNTQTREKGPIFQIKLFWAKKIVFHFSEENPRHEKEKISQKKIYSGPGKWFFIFQKKSQTLFSPRRPFWVWSDLFWAKTGVSFSK